MVVVKRIERERKVRRLDLTKRETEKEDVSVHSAYFEKIA